MPKVSIIIPVYNVEQYLSKCLESICNQTLKDIEIICVNDCSPDNSIYILREHSLKDSRIKIINKEKNAGLSAARNSGMEVATGEYISFIDSDDWIDETYIEKMYSKAIEHDIDVLLNTNMISVNEETEEVEEVSLFEGSKNTEGLFLDAKFSISNTIWSSCCRLYKKVFVEKNSLIFPENYIYEDMYFKSISELYTNKIMAFYGSRYYYRIRSNSIMTANVDYMYNHIKMWKLIYRYYKKYNFLSEYKVLFIDWNIFRALKDEKSFNLAKEFINFLDSELNLKEVVDKDINLFIIKILQKTETFEEYNRKFNKDIVLLFIRYKKDYLND